MSLTILDMLGRTPLDVEGGLYCWFCLVVQGDISMSI